MCGLRGDTDQWASCVAREATKYDKLNDDLIACAAYKSQPGLMHDLIESIACPFGIKSWCQTSDSTPYVYDKGYLQCLADVVARNGLDGSACAGIRDAQTWDECMVTSIRNGLPAARAEYWLGECARIPRTQPTGG